MSFKPKNTVAWTEIPVTDLETSMTFYKDVFNFEMMQDNSGPNPMAMIATGDQAGISGHLYVGKPASDGQGPTLHLNVPDNLEDTMARIEPAGGTLSQIPPISIPPGRFAYAQDPDGNSIGLFEPAAA